MCVLVDLQILDVPITNSQYVQDKKNIAHSNSYKTIDFSNMPSENYTSEEYYMKFLYTRAGESAYKLATEKKIESVFLIDSTLENTPIHLAILAEHPKLCEFLKKKGASLHKKNKLGRTPLDLAALQNEKIRNIFGVGEKKVGFEIKNVWKFFSEKLKLSKSIFGDNLRNIISKQQNESPVPDLVTNCIARLNLGVFFNCVLFD